jgi:hypothetical protein
VKARGGHANGLDGRGDISLRRPCLDIGKAGASQSLEACGIGGCFFHQFGKGIDVAATENQLGRDGSDEIARGSAAIAGRGGAAATHGLVDDEAKRLKLRWQNQQVGGGIDGGELRLVDKSEETDARSHAEAGGFGLKLGEKRAGAGEKKVRVGKIGFRKRTKEIERALPLL